MGPSVLPRKLVAKGSTRARVMLRIAVHRSENSICCCYEIKLKPIKQNKSGLRSSILPLSATSPYIPDPKQRSLETLDYSVSAGVEYGSAAPVSGLPLIPASERKALAQIFET
jgi:hypothetical protein